MMGDISLGTDQIYTFNQLIRERAEDVDQVPLIAYPANRFSVADYEFFTGAKINTFIDGAVKRFIETGLSPAVSN